MVPHWFSHATKACCTLRSDCFSGLYQQREHFFPCPWVSLCFPNGSTSTEPIISWCEFDGLRKMDWGREGRYGHWWCHQYCLLPGLDPLFLSTMDSALFFPLHPVPPIPPPSCPSMLTYWHQVLMEGHWKCNWSHIPSRTCHSTICYSHKICCVVGS